MKIEVILHRPVGCHADEFPVFKEHPIALSTGHRLSPDEARELAADLLKSAERADPVLKRLSPAHWSCGACMIQENKCDDPGRGESFSSFFVKDRGTLELVGCSLSLADAVDIACRYSAADRSAL